MRIREAQIALVNMGGLGNIGDRAMSLNVIRKIREQDPNVKILVGPWTIDFMVEEFNLQRYAFLSHCLGRWTIFRDKFPLIKNVKLLFPLYCLIKISYYVGTISLLFILTGLIKYFRVFENHHFMEIELARALSRSRVLYFCGGGYFTDAGQFDCRCNLIMALFAIFYGTPVVMSGQGLGPFNSRFTKLLLRMVIPRVDIITFRDKSGSVDYLKHENISFKKGGPAGDDALDLPAFKSNAFKSDPTDRSIAVNVRLSPFTEDLGSHLGEIQKFLEILETRHNWTIRFFIFETFRPNYEEDLVQRIIDEVGLKNYSIHKTEDPREALYWLSQCDVAFGVSYHAIEFALAAGIPAIALWDGDWYELKMLGLLEWYDHEDWTVSVRNFDPERTAELVMSVWRDRENLRHDLEEKTEAMVKNCRVVVDYALSLK